MSGEGIVAWAIGIIVLALVAFGFVAIYKSAASNGEIDYCYIEMLSPTGMAPQYQLYGHRPWRNDRAMGVYSTIEEATGKAESMKCALNKR